MQLSYIGQSIRMKLYDAAARMAYIHMSSEHTQHSALLQRCNDANVFWSLLKWPFRTKGLSFLVMSIVLSYWAAISLDDSIAACDIRPGSGEHNTPHLAISRTRNESVRPFNLCAWLPYLHFLRYIWCVCFTNADNKVKNSYPIFHTS